MAVSLVQEGDAFDYTPPMAVEAGSIVLFGGFVGVTSRPIAAGERGAVSIRGVYRFLKNVGTAFATVGARVFLTTWTGVVVPTNPGGTVALGKVFKAAVAADTTVDVMLCNQDDLTGT